jgi:hypothetical protein
MIRNRSLVTSRPLPDETVGHLFDFWHEVAIIGTSINDKKAPRFGYQDAFLSQQNQTKTLI